MDLLRLIARIDVPGPWAEGEKIPWDDPGFSGRMLREHLAQEHDRASRRFEKIDEHVAWIHHALLRRRPSRVLDLGCGPGLYTSRLARLGHECLGIDFSSASVAYARKAAERDALRCRYELEDIRTAQYGMGFDLTMLIFGEFNTFRPANERLILGKAFDALVPGGTLLLEPSTFEAIRQEGRQGPSWYSTAGGLFSDRPHLCLTEHFWDAETDVASTRYFVVEAEGQVTRYASSKKAYTGARFRSLLAECGFSEVTFFPSLTGKVDEKQKDLVAIVAQKQTLA